MKKYKLPLGFTIAFVILTVIACSFSTANIKDATLARDSEGNQPTTIFASDDTFYCIIELANAPDDTTVESVWIAVEAEGVQANFVIDQVELISGDGTLTFDLTNDKPWPTGKYKVDIYLNGKLDRAIQFQVQ